MKRIFKYPLELAYSGDDRVRLKLPGHPTMLSVHIVDEVPCLYCLVDPALPEMDHEFAVYGTGIPVPDQCGNYIGTFWQKIKKNKAIRAMTFVGHLFILRREV